MNVNKKLKEMIADSSWTQARMANVLGFPNAQVFNRRLLDSSEPKVGFVAAVLDQLGYELVMVPKGTDLPKESVVIESNFEFKTYPNRSNKEK